MFKHLLFVRYKNEANPEPDNVFMLSNKISKSSKKYIIMIFGATFTFLYTVAMVLKQCDSFQSNCLQGLYNFYG